MKVLAIILSVALIASVSGQDMLRTMMLMRMLGGNNGGSSSTGRGTSSAGGASSLLGRGGFNPALLALGGDRMRDIMMCNMYPRAMRGLCMARAFQ